MNKIELLAPASDFERAKYALIYGADAIYLGAKQYSLRARASNFEIDDIVQIVQWAHKLNKKVYLVTNVICHNFLIKEFLTFFKKVANIGIDGFICADPFIIKTISTYFPNCEIHISTQQSITNSKAALFWKKHNAQRIVLARELTLKEIEATTLALKDKIETEIFIHGAVCVAYSGRCMMSNNFSLRDANVGGCAQSCRWEYNLENLNKPFNHYFTMSAKDMSYYKYIEKLLSLPITSFKIEGRMKTVNYLTTVVKTYRKVIDDLVQNKDIDLEEVNKQLLKVANRPTDSAHLIEANEQRMLYHDEQRALIQSFIFNIIKIIDDYTFEIVARNNFNKDQKIMIVFPEQDDQLIEIDKIFNQDLQQYVNGINTPMTKAIIYLKQPLRLNLFCLGRIYG